MLLRVKNQAETPPGSWRYMVPETQRLIGPKPSLRDLMVEIRNHYRANELLMPTDIEQRVHSYMCALIPSHLCGHASGLNLIQAAKDAVIVFSTVVQGTMTIGEWFLKGRIQGKEELVSKVQANSRALICASCPYNVTVGGCAPCVAGQMANAIKRVVGNANTDHDHRLNACRLCGCSLKAKVWFPLGLLLKHMTEPQKNSFPEFCWLKLERVDQGLGKT